ncbi:hypothetical protein [Vibrio hippocampi]|uniref:RTX toxin n=1 Tax=Vibrio hippocampi TaxID=654686 RepID=A0ABN8DFX8_9VIBR|nr:hypothetical protein [Vibrio hippocampi]CAH0526161.1 hypothetical protein VHP8226_01635 [Vibrio hippocampi]
MSTVYTGYTNTDNTGSKLSEFNNSVDLDEGTFLNVDDVQLSDTGLTGVSIVNNGEWNQAGYKEVEVDTDKTSVFIENFVDVSITATSSDGVTIDVLQAKRGTIDTGSGDDVINVSVFSNENVWDNTFYIDSGAGDDTITLDHDLNSEYTEFSIDAGAGDDVVDISALDETIDDVADRFVDGGDGFDVLVISGEDAVTFADFEVIQGGEVNSALTVTAELLNANDSFVDPIDLGERFDESTLGLIFTNVDITLSGFDAMDIQEVDLSILQLAYLISEDETISDYSAYTIFDGVTTHTILTDDSDIMA